MENVILSHLKTDKKAFKIYFSKQKYLERLLKCEDMQKSEYLTKIHSCVRHSFILKPFVSGITEQYKLKMHVTFQVLHRHRQRIIQLNFSILWGKNIHSRLEPIPDYTVTETDSPKEVCLELSCMAEKCCQVTKFKSWPL